MPFRNQNNTGISNLEQADEIKPNVPVCSLPNLVSYIQETHKQPSSCLINKIFQFLVF